MDVAIALGLAAAAISIVALVVHFVAYGLVQTGVKVHPGLRGLVFFLLATGVAITSVVWWLGRSI